MEQKRKPRVVLLPTATGQGHRSASAAIAEALGGEACEAVILDVLKSGRRDVSFGVSRTYEAVTVHAPWLFRMLYDAGNFVSSAKRHSPVYYVNALNARPLSEKLRALGPDVVVCPHIFSAQTMTWLRLHGRCTVPTLGVMTDYTCSPFWEETALDAYIIPAPELTGEFVRKGMPKEKLYPLGIPVSSRFLRPRDTAGARAALGVREPRVYLLMGGSMGFGQLPQTAAALAALDPQARIFALSGHNETAYRRLCSIRGITALPYTGEIDRLMDAADVLLTKPGGLSSTEAAARRLPIVFTCPIPGCESVNSDFFVSMGMALSADRPEEAARLAVGLAGDAAACARMRAAQLAHIPGTAAAQIAAKILEMAGTGERVGAF